MLRVADLGGTEVMREVIEVADNPVVQKRKVLKLQEVMLQMPQFEEELHHHFCEGVYAREMRIPAGVVVVGKTHVRDCINFIMKGECEVVSAEEKARIKAPHVFVSPAGTKRAMVAISDLIWITVHASNERDLDKLEAELIREDEI